MIARVFLVLMSVAATMAEAQSEAWQAEVSDILADFDASIRNEQIVPFLLPYEHLDVIAASAEYLGVSPAEYVDIALQGYAQSRDMSDIEAYDVLGDQRISGELNGAPWTVVSYAIDLDMAGFDLPALCNRLLIRTQDGQTYITQISDGSTAPIILSALPLYADILDRVPAKCDR
ncbi:MAG: hypothetical protein AAGL89_03660 [Pseudomonadota bacterium]